MDAFYELLSEVPQGLRLEFLLQGNNSSLTDGKTIKGLVAGVEAGVTENPVALLNILLVLLASYKKDLLASPPSHELISKCYRDILDPLLFAYTQLKGTKDVFPM